MGTANPELAKKAFGSARAELLKRFSKANEKNPDAKTEADFFEAMLFGFWQWPQDPKKKKAFCAETVRAAQQAIKGRNEADFKPDTWSADPDTGLASVHQALTFNDGKMPVKDSFMAEADEQTLADESKANCFNGKYEPYNKFKDAFETAANEVWKWNQEYHKNKEAITKEAKTDEEKAAKKAAFQKISENVDAKNLTAFAFQQESATGKMEIRTSVERKQTKRFVS